MSDPSRPMLRFPIENRSYFADWKSPREMLWTTTIHEHKHIPVDELTDFHHLKKAYEDILSKNTDLQILVELLRSKLYNRCKKPVSTIEEELQEKLQSYQVLISRLRDEIRVYQTESSENARRLEKKQELYMSIQDNLRVATEENISLRRSLEAERSDNLSFQEKAENKIKTLCETIELLRSKCARAEKERVDALVNCKETTLRLNKQLRHCACNCLLQSLLKVKLRIESKAWLQWKNCTVAVTVKYISSRKELLLRHSLESAHKEALENLNENFAQQLNRSNYLYKKLELKRDSLAKSMFSSNRVLLGMTINKWKSLTIRRVVAERYELRKDVGVLENKLILIEGDLQKTQGFIHQHLIAQRIYKGLLTLSRIHVTKQGKRVLRGYFKIWIINAVLLPKLYDLLNHETKLREFQQLLQVAQSQNLILDAKYQQATCLTDKYEKCLLNSMEKAANLKLVGSMLGNWKSKFYKKKLYRISHLPQLWKMTHLVDDKFQMEKVGVDRIYSPTAIIKVSKQLENLDVRED